MLRLGAFLPYLVNRVGAHMVARYNRDLRPYGINVQAWRVLAALREEDGIRVSRLSAVTSIDPSTLSRVLDGMQRKGLLRRRRPAANDGGGDSRSVTVRTTEAGRALTRRILPFAVDLERRALRDLSGREAALLKALLARVYGNLTAPDGGRTR